MTPIVDPTPPSVYIRLIDTVKIPTPTRKPYVLFISYDMTHSLTTTVCPQGICPTPLQKPFRSVPSIKGLKMVLSSDDEYKGKGVHIGAHLGFIWETL